MENIVERIKLLMEYDTSKTLSENILVTEQASMADDVARGLGILGKQYGDDIVQKAAIKSTANKAITSVDDFVKLAKQGKITAINVGRVQSGLLKSASLKLTEKSAMINRYVNQAYKQSKGLNRTAKEISDDLARKGFPKDVADDIGNKLVTKYKKAKLGPSTGKSSSKPATGKSSSKPAPKKKGTKRGGNKNLKPSTPPPTTNPTFKDKLKNFLSKFPNANWKQILGWGAGLGITGAVLWYLFYDNDEIPAPEDLPEVQPEPEPVVEPPVGGGGGGTSWSDAPSCEDVQNGGASMSKGMMGDCVGAVQTKLNEVISAGLKVDNKFGKYTKNAVEAFQTKNGISATGTVDKETYEKLFGAATTGSDYEEAQDTVSGTDETF